MNLNNFYISKHVHIYINMTMCVLFNTLVSVFLYTPYKIKLLISLTTGSVLITL